jgi:hypothetical protein
MLPRHPADATGKSLHPAACFVDWAAHIDVYRVSAFAYGFPGGFPHKIGATVEELNANRLLIGINSHQLRQLAEMVDFGRADHLRV